MLMAAMITFPTPCQLPKSILSPLPSNGVTPSVYGLSYFCRTCRFPLNFNCKDSRRISNYRRICVYGPKENDWEGNNEDGSGFQEEEGYNVEAYYEEEEEDEEEEDRSLDLLARFIHHMFKKISRKARKAAKTVLPSAISPQLVTFSVNGVIILSSLSILKAFLQVLCTLGSVVFVTILLLRLVWSAIAYIRKGGKTFEFHGDNGYSSYSASRPAT